MQWVLEILFTALSFYAETPPPPPKPLPMQQECMGTVFGTVGDKLDGDVAACGGAPLTEHTLGIAHRRLPCGTRVRITVPGTGKSVVAKVVDRGPYGAGEWGHDWYVKRKEHEPPPARLCKNIGDNECEPRPWRGCVDMLPAVGAAVGLKGRARVQLRVIELPKKRRRKRRKK